MYQTNFIVFSSYNNILIFYHIFGLLTMILVPERMGVYFLSKIDMKPQLKAVHEFMESLIKIFNFTFFLASVLFWIFVTVKNISTQPFEFGLLWSAFNEMYGQFSFKVGCIFLIIFNGLATIRGFFQQYTELAEHAQHTHRIRRFLAGIFFRKSDN